MSAYGSRLVFPADEFYLQAMEEFPPVEAYEDLLQLENGIGLWPLFKAQFINALEKFRREGPRRGNPVTFWLLPEPMRPNYGKSSGLNRTRFSLGQDPILPVTNYFWPGSYRYGTGHGGGYLPRPHQDRSEKQSPSFTTQGNVTPPGKRFFRRHDPAAIAGKSSPSD